MKVYIMRHGETVWNSKGIIQGRSKNRLSKNGINQVKIQSKNHKNIEFDLIISSPLFRTIQTAKIMQLNQNCRILKNEKLTEINQGVFTGRSKDLMTDEDWNSYGSRSKEFGLETYDEVQERVDDFINEIKTKYKDKTILIVTHGAVAKRLLCTLRNEEMTNEEIFAWRVFDNAEIEYVKL